MTIMSNTPTTEAGIDIEIPEKPAIITTPPKAKNVHMASGVIKYTPTEDIGYVNMLIYGPFGSGKTILAATAQQCPEMANVLFVDGEGGIKSIRDFGIAGVDTIRINNFPAFNKLYEFLKKHAHFRDIVLSTAKDDPVHQQAWQNLIKLESWLKGKTEEEIAEPRLYQTVVLDSLTEIQKYAMYHILGIDINQIALDADPVMPQIQHWGKNAEMIRLLVRAFRDLEMHTIFTTLDTVDKDERDGSVMVGPSLPGKLSREIPAFLDIVGFMHVLKDPADPKLLRRVLQVQPQGKYNAKSRYKSLGTAIEHPTMAKIFKTILSSQS